MSDVKVRPCVDCGEEVEEVPIRARNDRVRCSEHTKQYKQKALERRRRLNREAQARRRNHPHSCEWCGTDFRGKLNQRFCSRKCGAQFASASDPMDKPCVDCGSPVRVASNVRRDHVRCEPHREEHRLKMEERHRASGRGKRNVEPGKAPYEDYVVQGPMWSSQPEAYGWRVLLMHRSNSNQREMSLAHYRLSVKEERRIRDYEEVVFLDGDIDNCSPDNLQLASKEREVA